MSDFYGEKLRSETREPDMEAAPINKFPERNSYNEIEYDALKPYFTDSI